MKMVAGVINPGLPVANLYVSSNLLPDEVSCLSLITKKFSMWSHDVIATSAALAGDLKIGQYLKIPPRVMFLTQVWGTLVGWSFVIPCFKWISDPTIAYRRLCQLW